MTNDDKALVERLREVVLIGEPDKNGNQLATSAPDIQHEAADRIEALSAENERLREALGWYEKQANDCRKITKEGDDARYALDKDGGEHARAALGEQQ